MYTLYRSREYRNYSNVGISTFSEASESSLHASLFTKGGDLESKMNENDVKCEFAVKGEHESCIMIIVYFHWRRIIGVIDCGSVLYIFLVILQYIHSIIILLL